MQDVKPYLILKMSSDWLRPQIHDFSLSEDIKCNIIIIAIFLSFCFTVNRCSNGSRRRMVQQKPVGVTHEHIASSQFVGAHAAISDIITLNAVPCYLLHTSTHISNMQFANNINNNNVGAWSGWMSPTRDTRFVIEFSVFSFFIPCSSKTRIKIHNFVLTTYEWTTSQVYTMHTNILMYAYNLRELWFLFSFWEMCKYTEYFIDPGRVNSSHFRRNDFTVTIVSVNIFVFSFIQTSSTY